MDNTTARAELLLKWAPVLFAGAVALLLISARKGPLSGGYLLRAVVIGVIYSALTISFRKWESTVLNSLILTLLISGLIGGGFFWSRDQTFGDVHVGGQFWALLGQFLAAVLAVHFAVLSVLGLKSKRAQDGDAR